MNFCDLLYICSYIEKTTSVDDPRDDPDYIEPPLSHIVLYYYKLLYTHMYIIYLQSYREDYECR